MSSARGRLSTGITGGTSLGAGERGGFGRGRGRGSNRGGPSRGGGRGSSSRGRGTARGGGRGGSRGARAPNKVLIEKHRHEGVYIAKGGKDDALVTKNLDPGFSVYGEKRISVESPSSTSSSHSASDKIEYRVWNPFRSKLCAAIVSGIEHIYIGPGTRLLYLGAASGTTVSHCSDIVGPSGVVYAVEFSHRSGRDLTNLAKRRPNIIPIVEDARYPLKYRMLISMVDCIFADVAQPDQARIVGLNAQYFLKNDGHCVISIKANCIDSTVDAEQVFASEINKLRTMQFTPKEYVTLEPYERDHAVVVGTYRPSKKQTK